MKRACVKAVRQSLMVVKGVHALARTICSIIKKVNNTQALAFMGVGVGVGT